MRTILAPDHLPRRGVVHVSAAADLSSLLFDLLRALRPEVSFRPLDGLPADPDVVLLTEPGWRAEQRRLSAAGLADDAIALMPLPVGDPWGWWQWAERAAAADGGIAGALAAGSPLPPNAEGTPFGNDRHFPCFQMHKLSAGEFRRLQGVMAGLADDTDRDALRLVLTGTPEDLAARYRTRLFSTVQYAEHVVLSPGCAIVNGGVHLGSEIPLFLALQPALGAIHCFDPSGFAHLSPYAARWSAAAGSSVVEAKMALADRIGWKKLLLCPDGQLISRLPGDGFGEERLRVLPAMTLEAYAASRDLRRLDLIKLDLEGDEQTVIPSLLPLIQRFRPQLAFSIYHDIRHFWEIPELLMAGLEGYRFHVGHYSSQGYETILYAIPRG